VIARVDDAPSVTNSTLKDLKLRTAMLFACGVGQEKKKPTEFGEVFLNPIKDKF
jgi:hypothetical protein